MTGEEREEKVEFSSMKNGFHSSMHDEVGQRRTIANETGRKSNQTRVALEGIQEPYRGSRQKLEESANRKLSVGNCVSESHSSDTMSCPHNHQRNSSNNKHSSKTWYSKHMKTPYRLITIIGVQRTHLLFPSTPHQDVSRTSTF